MYFHQLYFLLYQSISYIYTLTYPSLSTHIYRRNFPYLPSNFPSLCFLSFSVEIPQTMTIVRERRVVGRRSRRRCDTGMSYGLDLLAEAALSVDQCGCGRNSADPFLCFLTAKQRKAAFRRLHLSLLLTPQAPKKRRIVFLPPRRPPSPSAAFPPTVDDGASAPFLLPLQQASSSSPLALIPENFTLQRPPPSPAACFYSPTFPASITVSPTSLPVSFEATDDFPQFLKSRVSAIVGGVLGNTYILAIRKKLTMTDLSFQNLRLSIPLNQVAHDFLTNEEKLQFDNGEKIKLGFSWTKTWNPSPEVN